MLSLDCLIVMLSVVMLSVVVLRTINNNSVFYNNNNVLAVATTTTAAAATISSCSKRDTLAGAKFVRFLLIKMFRWKNKQILRKHLKQVF